MHLGPSPSLTLQTGPIETVLAKLQGSLKFPATIEEKCWEGGELLTGSQSGDSAPALGVPQAPDWLNELFGTKPHHFVPPKSCKEHEVIAMFCLSMLWFPGKESSSHQNHITTKQQRQLHFCKPCSQGQSHCVGFF